MWLLLFIPFLVRFLLMPRPTFLDVFLAILPQLIAMPSSYIQYWVRNEETEHVWRHAMFAIGYASSAIVVRWDMLEPDDLRTLGFYFVVGGATLSWYCLSHIIENRQIVGFLHTHQGDVVVLPITLVAISTFVNTLPDDAFRFSRSAIFFIPVIVGWSTMFFIAFNRFALRRVTTHTDEIYDFVALQSFIIASGHLILIETRADSIFYIFFAPIASGVIQCTYAPSARPTMYHNTLQRTVHATLVGFGMAGIGYPMLGTLAFYVYPVAFVLFYNSAAIVLGNRLFVPMTFYTTFLTYTLLDALEIHDLTSWLVVAGLYALGFELLRQCVDLEDHPIVLPKLPTKYDPVQRGSRLMRFLECIGSCELPGFPKYSTAPWMRQLSNTLDPNCPKALQGIWWMKDNTFPMDFICIHHLQWKHGVATLWNAQNTTRRATVWGVLSHLVSYFVVTRIEVVDDRWFRTVSHLSVLGLLQKTLWIHKQSENRLWRLVYDRDGNVVYHYELVRVASVAQGRTRVLPEYDECRDLVDGKKFVVKLG